MLKYFITVIIKNMLFYIWKAPKMEVTKDMIKLKLNIAYSSW